jgi:hypothetical protein
MPGGGSKPGEKRGGRERGTPNKTLTERAQALAAKVAKAEARANAKLVALAHAIQATVAESRGLPGASARERFKEVVLNALAAEKLALKEIAHEPENTSIAEPAAEPATAPDPDDADGVLVTEPAAEPAAAPDDADGVLVTEPAAEPATAPDPDNADGVLVR